MSNVVRLCPYSNIQMSKNGNVVRLCPYSNVQMSTTYQVQYTFILLQL